MRVAMRDYRREERNEVLFILFITALIIFGLALLVGWLIVADGGSGFQPNGGV